MIRLNIVVEGQTEEAFVNEVLQEHLQRSGIYATAILLRTSKTGRGGVTTFAKIENQVSRLCKEDTGAYVTTMLDYYGLPKDFPSVQLKNPKDIYHSVNRLEADFHDCIGYEQRFIPGIILHEFEALLFADVRGFEILEADSPGLVADLAAEVAGLEPEAINDSSETAPSKRILKHFRSYQKPFHGSLVAMNVGLDAMKARCPHFAKWLEKLERLKPIVP
ncbi:DUF4276 family protein [Endozoicomonas gorgoniicola]|uniref:DUF4276 family protein n=1 Tax=Endozoicomonas gorgoniicola TaxID=1234144 RepID=A0ABT3MW28_9GAMM|nr:DUF4276 family protein [Endozoicomonas gorgoniicola]MCW7553288.1 DUF4276 family protein [Endozoicomonas gorgoniicola]